MENKKRNRKINKKKGGKGLFRKLLSTCAGNPEEIEDQDWYLDSQDLRLTRVFSVVLILHIIAIGGILAFKMIDKASRTDPASVAKAQSAPAESQPAEIIVSSPADQVEDGDRFLRPEASLPEGPGNSVSGEVQVRRVDDIAAGSVKEWSDLNGVESEEKRAIVREYDQLRSGPETAGSDSADRMKGVAPIEPSPKAKKLYKVEKDDTVWAISRKFGVHHEVILRHNGIERPELLSVGQVLEIPEVP